MHCSKASVVISDIWINKWLIRNERTLVPICVTFISLCTTCSCKVNLHTKIIFNTIEIIHCLKAVDGDDQCLWKRELRAYTLHPVIFCNLFLTNNLKKLIALKTQLEMCGSLFSFECIL